MAWIGKRVKSKYLGIGTVIAEHQGRITVDFGHKQQDFGAPQAFDEGRLTEVGVAPTLTAPPKPPKMIAPPPPKPAVKLTMAEALHRIDHPVTPVWVGFSHQGDMEKSRKLAYNLHYGTKGKDIYLKGCDVFGWDRNLSQRFGMMQIMYARHGAPDGKSIWMLPHHGGVMKKALKDDAMWWNTFTEDYVFEEWKEPAEGFYTDWSERITFAKTINSGYAFIGVYRPEQILEGVDSKGRMRYIKVYHRIAKEYKG